MRIDQRAIRVCLLSALAVALPLAPAAWADSTAVSPASATATVVDGSSQVLSVPITRTGDTGYDVWVNYSTADGTATGGTDYTATSGQAEISAGNSSVDVPVVVAGAYSPTPDRYFSLNVSSISATGPAPSFASAQAFGTGSSPAAVATADFNGDGKLDVAVADESSNNLEILTNSGTAAGTASFSSGTVTTGSFPVAVVAADLNADGKPDLVAVDGGATTISVFINTTAAGSSVASFAARKTFTVGNSPSAVAVGDFNGDGKPDLAVSNFSDNNVSVLFNTTTAGSAIPAFSAASNFSTGTSPQSVAVGDLNGDGRPDLAIANYSSSNVSVLLNTAAAGATSPSFASATNFSVGSEPQSVAMVDLNGDGLRDLAVANFAGNSVSVLLSTTAAGATAPSFATQQVFWGGNLPATVTVADLNGDGKPDLAMAARGDTSVALLMNTTAVGSATTSFVTQGTLSLGVTPQAATLADVDGDGKPDVLALDGHDSEVQVLLNTTAASGATPGFAARKSFLGGLQPVGLAVADINGDGKPDALTCDFDSKFSVFLGTTSAGATTPSFGSRQAFTETSSPTGITAADFNGDGKPDVVVVNFGTPDIHAYVNTTSTGATTVSFAAAQTFTATSAPASVVAVDLNGDGKPDLVEADTSLSRVWVLINTTTTGSSTLSFSAAQSFTAGDTPNYATAADVNGDGKPDLLVANRVGNTVSVLVNTTAAGAPTASFAATQDFATGNGAWHVAVGDLNGDGLPDLAVADSSAATVSVLLNQTTFGSATVAFATKVDFTVGTSPLGVTIADLDGDGLPDIATANISSTSLSVLKNTTTSAAATPTFATVKNYTATSNPRDVVAADLNGDGMPDLVTDNSVGGSSQGISVLLNSEYAATLSATSISAIIDYALSTPVAADLSLTTTEGQALSGTLPAAVSPSSDTESFSVGSIPGHGTVTITDASTGAFTYTPAAGYTGTDAFTFKVTDTVSNLTSNTGSVILTVNGVTPVASSISLSTFEHQALSGTLPAAVYPSSDAKSFVAGSASHGTVSVTNAATGAFTYTPAAGYSGADSFTFTAKDTATNLTSNTATVSITVGAVAPVAGTVSLNGYQDTALSGSLPASVTPSTDTLNFVATAASHGTVSVTDAATGAFTYTPTAGYSGTDSFTFTAKDTATNLTSNTATVSIAVAATPPPADVAPAAGDVSLTGYQDTVISGVLPASVTPAGDALSFAAGSAGHGTVSVTDAATGAFTYTPAAGYAGSDSFTFTAKDTVTNLTSNTATVSVTVTAVAPVASSVSLTTYEDEVLSSTLPAAVTPGADTLDFVAGSAGHGTVSVTDAATGAFTYTPTAGYSGTDSFTFTAKDVVSGLTSNTATVSLTVAATPSPVAVAPVASALSLVTYARQAVSGTLPAVVTPATDALSFAAGAAAHGTVTVTDAATGAFTYTPARGFTGADSFTFVATDTVTSLPSNTATVAVTVDAVPVQYAVPVASGEELAAYSGQALQGQLAAVASNGHALSYALMSQPAHGKVKLTAASGAFTYTPDAGFTGNDSFTFDADDGSTQSNVAKVQITVSAVPTGTPTTGSSGSGGGGSFSLLMLGLLGFGALRRKR